MTTAYCYGSILSKSIDASDPDGTPRAVLVTGKVTGGGLDLDGQRVDQTWAGEALQEWFQRAGNIRLQHDRSKVAGAAIDLFPAPDGDGFCITARVTHPDAIKGLLEEPPLYKGFSIGVSRKPYHRQFVVADKSAPGGRIAGGLIHEISLVDAPSLPDARVSATQVLYKAAGGDDDPDGLDALASDAPDDGEPELTKAAIPHKEGEPQSPPKGYPQDKADYADPANYSWPIDSPARVRSAMAYYNAGRGKAKYSAAEWATIGRAIAAAANEHFGAGHSLQNGQIEHKEDGADKGLTERLEAGFLPVLTDLDGTPILGNVRVLVKASAPLEAAVAPDLRYSPYPTELRDGFGAPPHAAEGAFDAPPEAQEKATAEALAPNGLHAGASPSAAGRFQPQAHAVNGFGAPPETTAALESDLTKAAGDASGQTIEKNGVARNLGPSATSLLYQMLLNEVQEDGGSGQMADDIKMIAVAYCELQCFISEELEEEGEAGPLAMGAKSADGAGLSEAERASLAAVHDFAASRNPDCCDCYQTRHASASAATDKSADDDRPAPDLAAEVAALTARLDTLQAANDNLTKQLDATPIEGGPLRAAVPGAVEVSAHSSQAAREAWEALTDRIGRTNDPLYRQALIARRNALARE